MRIEQLQYITEVAQSQSLSKAAKKLHISQPCLTNAINSLENEMGFKIFNRTSSGATVTLLGQEVLQYAERILQQVNQLQYLSQHYSDGRGDIHLAAVPAVCNGALTEIMASFHQLFPNITIYVHETRPENMLTALKKGLYSIAVFNRIDDFQPLERESLAQLNFQTYFLYRDKFAIFASSQSPLRQEKTVTCQMVMDRYAAATQIVDQILMTHYNSHPILANFIGNSQYNYTDRENVKHTVISDQAIATLPSSFCYRDFYAQSGLWGTLDVVDFDIPVTFYLIYPNRQVSPHEKALVNCIKEFYQDWPKEEGACYVPEY